MGIRNKTGKPAPADAFDSRHSLEEPTRPAPARTRREQGRRLPFAPTKTARRLPQTEKEFDPEFEAACRAMALNDDRVETEHYAQASSTLITSPPKGTDPAVVSDPLQAAAATIEDEAAFGIPDEPAASVSQPLADDLLAPFAPAAADSGSAPAGSERDETEIRRLRADAERHCVQALKHQATIEHQSSLIGEYEAEVSRLRNELTEQRQQIESLKRTAGRHEREVAGLREALARTEDEAVSQTQMLMHSLHETEVRREAEVAELGSAAQRLSEAQRELSALRRMLDNTEAQRKATSAELVAAAERESEAEREALRLRQTISVLSKEHDDQIGELRALVSRREMEATALDQALLERESEWAELHAAMTNRDTETTKLIEELRRALLHNEAQREADAAALLEIMARQAAAESVERANEMAREHLTTG